ncbi:MAG: chemotaxis protein CheW [Prochlorothrix sp.]
MNADFPEAKSPPKASQDSNFSLAPLPSPLDTLKVAQNSFSADRQLQDCWNKIGVVGDHTCPQLQQVIHCQNCSVYSAAGRSLLERNAPPGYLEDWQQVLGETKTEPKKRAIEADPGSTLTQTLIIFRLGQETLAFPVALLQRVMSPEVIHRVPHRQNSVLLGLVNVRGEILLCLSLAALLSIAATPNPPAQTLAKARWLVMGEAGQPWVTPVDEIYGIHRVQTPSLEAPPIVVTQTTVAYTRGIVSWQGGKATVLDSDRLLAAFQQVSA